MTTKVVPEWDPSARVGPLANQSLAADVDARLPFTAIDFEQFLRQCVGNTNFATSLLNIFEQTCESRRAKFNGAVIEDRNDVIAHEAHALKGVAGILAANKLTDLCVELQAAAEATDWFRIRNLIESLHHEMQRVIDCIPYIRALGSSKSIADPQSVGNLNDSILGKKECTL